MEFSIEQADDCTWSGDATMLDDYRRRWPLLRQPWIGVSMLTQWPPSPWLELVKAGRIAEAKAWVRTHAWEGLS